MRYLLRQALGITPGIDEAEALRIAHKECERRGWPWEGEVRADERLRSFRIWTNYGLRGGNAIVIIDIESGDVRRFSYGDR